jgi:hypothetical protein
MQSGDIPREGEDPSMASRPGPSGTGDAGSAGTPRWVKVSAVIAVVVVLLVVVMLLFGGGPGGHGPQRHRGGDGAARETPSGETRSNTAPSGAREQSRGHTGPPPGIDHDP